MRSRRTARAVVCCAAGLALLAAWSAPAQPVAPRAAPDAGLPFRLLRPLLPTGSFDTQLVPENSGMVQSRRHPGVFWTLSDSGGPQTLVPLTRQGELAKGWRVVALDGVRNTDWEDITFDARGRLVVADIGNNFSRRRTLEFYFFREPPEGAATARPEKVVLAHYADQKEFPPARRDYDAEAAFTVGGRIHVLTKHRSDTRTRLYRLEGESPRRSNPLVYVDSFEIGGMVTAADNTPDGRFVAVLTYHALWLFEYDPASGSLFRRSIRWMPIFAWQCESVAFIDEGKVLISNEQGWLFEVALDSMTKVR